MRHLFKIVLWNGKHKGRADTRNNWGTGVTVAKMHLNNAFFVFPSPLPPSILKKSPQGLSLPAWKIAFALVSYMMLLGILE